MDKFDDRLELAIEWEGNRLLAAVFSNQSEDQIVLRSPLSHEIIVHHESGIESLPAIHSFISTTIITTTYTLDRCAKLKLKIALDENRHYPLAGEWSVWIKYDGSYRTGTHADSTFNELELPPGVQLSELCTTSNLLTFTIDEEEVYNPPPLDIDLEKFNRAAERMKRPWCRRLMFWLLGR